MVLAGARACGKSTVLRRCLRESIPLFGERYQADFRRFAIPARENLRSIEAMLAQGSWINTPHLRQLVELPGLPATVLAHIDLMTFCSARRRSYVDIDDPAANCRWMKRYPGAAAFDHYDEIVINTLDVSFDVCARLYKYKSLVRRTFGADRVRTMYDTVYSKKMSYDSIYEGWKMFVSTLKVRSNIVTTYAGRLEDLSIKMLY